MNEPQVPLALSIINHRHWHEDDRDSIELVRLALLGATTADLLELMVITLDEAA